MDRPFAGCASGQSWPVGAADATAVAPGHEAAACYRRAIPVGKGQPIAVTVTRIDHQISFAAGGGERPASVRHREISRRA